jgi:hypothetical protein
MAANIDANLANWSTTDSSNQPDGTDPADIDADLRRLQATVRKYTRTIGANIASGATVDLATASGDYVTVTGTATITSLGTVSAGMRFWIAFNGAAVLTHNGTSLILPGAANITCASGDVACVESLGSGNWRVVSYLKASGLPIAGNFATAGANSNITSLTGLTTPLSVAQGGTGGANEAAAKAALNLETGVDLMPWVAPSTSGQVLTSNGSAWTSATPASNVTRVAAQSITSTGITFSGIPSTASVIYVQFRDVSTNGTQPWGFLLNSESSGYSGVCTSQTGATRVTMSTYGALNFGTQAAQSYSGILTLNRSGTSGNNWVFHGGIAETSGSDDNLSRYAGDKSTSAALSSITITRVGADTFDNGSVSISYI